MGIENLMRLLERIRRETKYLKPADKSGECQGQDTERNG